MLRRFILSLRRKPKEVRNNYAFGIATGITVVVVAVWMYHWPSMIASRQSATPEQDEKPLASFMERAKEQIANARQSTEADLSTLEEVVEPTEQSESAVNFEQAFTAGPRPPTSTSTTSSGVGIATTSTTTSSSTVVQ